MSYKVIAIYWNNDSNELMDLPNVKTVTCGNDGLEVLGTSYAIGQLHQAVVDNPDKFTLADGPRKATERDFTNAIDFSQGNWPEFGDKKEVEDYLN